MQESPPGRAQPRDRRRGLLVGAVILLVLLAVVWTAGSMRPQAAALTAVATGSVSTALPTASPTRRPSGGTQPVAQARQVDLFSHEMQLTLQGGNYSVRGNQATVVGPWMRVEIERWPAGSQYTIARGIPGAVSGSTLDEVADEVDLLLGSGGATHIRRTKTVDYHEAVEWVASHPIPTDGRPFIVTLVIDGTTVYLVEAYATEPGREALTHAAFASLQASINFLTPSDITGLGGRVSVRLPGTLHVGTSTGRLLLLDAESGFFGFGFGPPISIQRVRLGARVTIDLPGEEDRQATVDGRTLDDIVDAFQRTSDGMLRKGIRAPMTVDGHPGYQWTYVIETSLSAYFGPFHGTVGVVVVGPDVYVIIGRDEDLLRSIRFLR